jgi:GNAT superfamily N-acetyltransferase
VAPLDIRNAGPDDLAALARLVAAFREHLDDRGLSDEDLARYLPHLLDDPSIEFACAWQDGRAIGYTHLRFFDSLWQLGVEAHLEDIFVEKPLRRAAVGRALLDHAIARARARGARRIGLLTNARNEVAHGLYRAAGLRPETHRVYPDGFEVLWVKRLAPA